MSFDYEQSIWGRGVASINFGSPTAIRLRAALRAIEVQRERGQKENAE